MTSSLRPADLLQTAQIARSGNWRSPRKTDRLEMSSRTLLGLVRQRSGGVWIVTNN